MMNTNILPKNTFKLLSVLFCMFLLLTSCDKTETPAETTPITKSAMKLDTIITITIYDSDDESILDECLELCDYYENLFSKTIPESEIYQLNQNRSYTVSDETADLIQQGLYYSNLSNGAFNICVASLTDLWDFSDERSVPDEDKIQEAILHTDYNQLTSDGSTFTFLDSNTGIDLGAIAKGYIADRMKDFLISKGVESAIINLGGNILLIGGKPDGSDFKIGIQKPFEFHNEIIAKMHLKDVSVVSSGIYERYFVENGKLYHHIVNPFTGYPYDNDLISVTIISNESVDGDALSTAVFALGLEEGLALIDSIPDTYAVLITSDYELHYSDGLLEDITVIPE